MGLTEGVEEIGAFDGGLDACGGNVGEIVGNENVGEADGALEGGSER